MDGYQVGRFPPPWCEWNDKYRDTVRDFWRLDAGRHPGHRLPAGRVERPVRRRRPLAVRLGQLRHRARRVHAARPGVLRPQAQRGEPRAQPGRHRQQPVVELRRRGRDRRPDGRRAAAQAGRQPARHAVPVDRGADDHRRRRAGPHPARQQQRLRARTTRSSWMDWRPDDAWLDLYDVAKTALRLRREHPALRQRHFLEGRPTVRGRPRRTSPGCTRRVGR